MTVREVIEKISSINSVKNGLYDYILDNDNIDLSSITKTLIEKTLIEDACTFLEELVEMYKEKEVI